MSYTKDRMDPWREATRARLGAAADMKWVTFFFDANPVFGEVEDAVQWCFVCERIAADWHLSYEGAVHKVMTEAMMAPIADIPPEYKPDPTSSTLPGKVGIVPTHIPSFGFRWEHIGGKVALVGWAAAHGIDLWKAAGLPPETP